MALEVLACWLVVPLIFGVVLGHFTRWYAAYQFALMALPLACGLRRLESRPASWIWCTAMVLGVVPSIFNASKYVAEPVAKSNEPAFAAIRGVLDACGEAVVATSSAAFYAAYSPDRAVYSSKPQILLRDDLGLQGRIQYLILMTANENEEAKAARIFMANNGRWEMALDYKVPRGDLIQLLAPREPFAKSFEVWRRLE